MRLGLLWAFNLNDLHLNRLIARCDSELLSDGYKVEQVFDHRAGETRARALRDKTRSAPFSLEKHDFTKKQMFWLFLTCDGVDVGCCAARLDTFAKNELADYWLDSYARIYGERHVAPDGETPEFLSRVYGRVAYLGEFFIAPDHRGVRNRLRRYTHILLGLCIQTLKADWMYVFIPTKSDSLGYGRVYGFQHFEEGALIWNIVPSGRVPETFCAVSASEVYEKATLYERFPAEFEVAELAE